MEKIVLFAEQCNVLAMFLENIDVNSFDTVLQNTKHRANDASNDVNRPPLVCCNLPPLGHISLNVSK